MSSILNHIKKGESLSDKQLVIFNSDYRDDVNQTSNSFTYTFSEPIDRVCKIDINCVNIPKSYYNVNNDGTTMNFITTNINETYNQLLNVEDTEIQNNIIQSSNKLNGSINTADFLTSTGDTKIQKTITTESYVYKCGTYSIGPLNSYPINMFNSLSNEGFTDIFISKYDITQNFIWRLKISGVLNEFADIAANSNFVLCAGVSISYPLTFYNNLDTADYSIFGGENNIAFLVKYTTDGEFSWVTYIKGVNNDTVKSYIDNTNEFIYFTAQFADSTKLTIYDKTGSIITKTITGTGVCSLIAQYSFDGVLIWINTFSSGNINTLNINPMSTNPLVGLEITDTLIYYKNGVFSNSTVSTGAINSTVYELDTTGAFVNSILIGGSGQNTNIRIDSQDNKLVITGLYNSNPVYFTNTLDLAKQLLPINGIYKNLFVAVYELNGVDKTIKWCANTYSNDNITNCDASISPLFDIILSFNYSNLLKFNDITGYLPGQNLINDDGNNYICECAYDILGNFQYRNSIQSQSGSVYNTSVDAKSQFIFISANTDATSVQCYNTGSNLVANEYTFNQTNKKYYGGLFSLVSNVNNFIIDKTTLTKNIIKKAFNYFDLSYIIVLNAFSQNLGFTISKKFNSMVFGTPINWSSLIVNDVNYLLSIDFTIFLNNKFTEYNLQFYVIPAVYNPYSLAYGLTKSINEIIRTNNIIESTVNFVTYDSDKQIFYVTFGINGVFKINQTPLSIILNLPISTSYMCAISDISKTLTIQDGSKLLLKMSESIQSQLYTDSSFNDTFPNISSQTNSIILNAIENTNTNMTIFCDQQTDIQLNDKIIFDSPWTKQDNINTIFKDSYKWCGSAISNGGNIICLIAKDNFIYVSNDAGVIWNRRCIRANWTGIDISMYDDNNCIITAVASNSNIYVSDDSGLTWASKDSIRNWYDISISNDGIIQIAVELGGYVYISYDSGATWQANIYLGINNWTSISINGTYAVVCAYNGKFHISTNCIVWSPGVNLIDEWVSCDLYSTYAVIVSRLGYLYTYNFTTTTTTKKIIDTLNKAPLLSKISVSNNGLYQVLIGNVGDLYYSYDTGSTWNKSGIIDSWGAVSLEKNINNLLYGVSAISYGDIYKITIPDTISLEPILVIDFIGTAMSSDGSYQVAYTTDNLYDSYDYGNTWKLLKNSSNIRKVVISNNGNIQIIASNAGLLITNDKWVTNTSYLIGVIFEVNLSGSGAIQMCSTLYSPRKLYLSTNYGINFNELTYFGPSNPQVPSFNISNDGNYILVYSEIPFPSLFLSTNFGVSFTSLGTIGISGAYIGLSNNGQYQTSISPGTPSNNFNMSQNYGQTWNITSKTLINNTTSLAVSSSGQYQTFNNFTNMYNSNDYGQTWTLNITNNTLGQISMSASGLYQACTINGDIYQSTNYGVSWYKINVVYGNTIDIEWVSSAISDGKYMLASPKAFVYTSNNYLLSLQKNIAYPYQFPFNSCMSGDGKIQIVCCNQNSMPINYSTDYGQTWVDPIPSLNDNGLGLCDIVTISSNYYLCISSVTGLYWSIILFAASTITFTKFTNISFTPKCVSVKLINISGSVNIYCFMENGVINYSNDFGTSWSNITLSGSPTLLNGDISNDGQIVIAASNSSIITSTTGISGTFTVQSTPIQPRNIQLLSNNYIYIMNNISNDYLYKSSDFGVSWVRAPIKSEWSYLNKSENSNSLISSSINGNLMVSYDMNDEWLSQPKKIQPSYVALSSDGKYQTILSAGRYIYVSDTYGKIKTVASPLTNNWRKIAMTTTGQYQTIIPYYGKIVVSQDYGQTWIEENNDYYWNDIAILSGAEQYAILQISGIKYIYKSTDYWYTKTDMTPVPNRDWGNISVSSTYLYVTVINGNIYRMNLSTNVWTETLLTANWSGISAYGVYVVAVAYQDYIYVSVDSGLTFNAKQSKLNWNNCDISPGFKFYTSTLGGSLYYSTDFGNNWVSNENNKLWNSIEAGTSNVIAVNYNNDIYSSLDNGKNYYLEPDLFDIISIDSSNHIQVVAQNNSGLSISKDNGKSYNLMFNIVASWTKIKISNSYKLTTTEYVIVAVAYNNYVYISVNTGTTFTKITSIGTSGISGWQSCDISDDGQYITVVSFEDKLYVSDDYGATWTDPIPTSYKWYSIAMSNTGQYQTAVSQDYKLYKSNDYGVAWTLVNIGNYIYQDISISETGQYQTIVTRGYNLYTSNDYGVSWVAKNITKKWLCIRMSNDASKQYALVDQESTLYYSTDKWVTYVSIETTYLFKDLYVSATGSYQLGCTSEYLYLHSFNIDKQLTLNVNTITNQNNINTIVFSELASDPYQNLVPIHGFNMVNGTNYTLIRSIPSSLTNIYIKPANYTPQTLVDAINATILQINPLFINPFKYIPETNKITFTAKFSGNVIESTILLTSMGFTEIPNSGVSGRIYDGNYIVNSNFTGPSALYIKSDIISNVKKNQTVSSKNSTILNSIISPISITNILSIPMIIEIYLSRKATFETIDIQIVDNNGNIVNLNGGVVQLSTYFIRA